MSKLLTNKEHKKVWKLYQKDYQSSIVENLASLKPIKYSHTFEQLFMVSELIYNSKNNLLYFYQEAWYLKDLKTDNIQELWKYVFDEYNKRTSNNSCTIWEVESIIHDTMIVKDSKDRFSPHRFKNAFPLAHDKVMDKLWNYNAFNLTHKETTTRNRVPYFNQSSKRPYNPNFPSWSGQFLYRDVDFDKNRLINVSTNN